MITVEKLKYTYPNENHPAVKNVSFEVKKGEILGLLGPSGAGKSTTQKVLIQLLTGYEGRVNVLGKELSQWTKDYYNHIGVGFELPNHYSRLTALENLEFFRAFYDNQSAKPIDLLEAVGLSEYANKKVSEFSKGMKMRLNFIRALLHDPDLLFLDEPTSGLDPVNAEILKKIILSEKEKGKTIFLTTHNMYDADELCDQVAFIIDGEIKIIDSPRKLKLQYSERKVVVNYEEQGLKKEQFDMDRLADNSAFLALLRTKNIESIHSTDVSLNEVFIRLTGKSLL